MLSLIAGIGGSAALLIAGFYVAWKWRGDRASLAEARTQLQQARELLAQEDANHRDHVVRLEAVIEDQKARIAGAEETIRACSDPAAALADLRVLLGGAPGAPAPAPPGGAAGALHPLPAASEAGPGDPGVPCERLGGPRR